MSALASFILVFMLCELVTYKSPGSVMTLMFISPPSHFIVSDDPT